MRIVRALGSVAAMLILPSAIVFIALRPALVYARDSGWSVDLTRIFFAGVVLVGLAAVFAKSRQRGLSVVRAVVDVVITLVTSVALSIVVLLSPFFVSFLP